MATMTVAALHLVGCAPETEDDGADGQAPPDPARAGVACHHDPFVCGPEETCWRTGDDPAAYTCLAARRGAAKGASCEPDEAAATCDAGLFCGGLPLDDRSTCLAYCDPDAEDACSAGESCVRVDPDGAPHHACVGPDTFG